MVIHPNGALRAYASDLLRALGFRHVLTSPDLETARRFHASATKGGQQLEVILCDDTLPEGALAVGRAFPQVPCLVVTDRAHAGNVRLAAALGARRLLTRPFGRSHLEKALSAL